jgi:hypothetical protein
MARDYKKIMARRGDRRLGEIAGRKQYIKSGHGHDKQI